MRINLIHHNVRSWTNFNNRQALSNYYLSNNPDIITINSHSITNNNKFVKLLHYSGYTKNKEAHAGVAILIKYNIPTFFTLKQQNQT